MDSLDPRRERGGIGTVALAEPTEPLMRNSYRVALAGRIDRLVKADDPEDARAAIEATVGAAEPQLVPDALSQLGAMLVWDSETLIERSGMMATSWPIPVATLRSQIDPELIAETTLEEWLGLLYHGIV